MGSPKNRCGRKRPLELRQAVTMNRTGGGFVVPAVSQGPLNATHPAILKLFNPARDSKSKVPYHEQGDKSMYTPESLAARQSLREHPAVFDAIRRFASLYERDAENLITFSAYRPVNLAISRTLIPTMTPDEASCVIEEDWDEDRGERDRLDDTCVFTSIFEIADQWCPGLSAEEYVS